MTKQDKDSSDKTSSEEGVQKESRSSSTAKLKASLAKLQKTSPGTIPGPSADEKPGARKTTLPRAPNTGSPRKKTELLFSLPAPAKGARRDDAGLDEDSDEGPGTDRISAEDLEMMSFSEASEVDEVYEEARTQVVSPDLIPDYALQESPDDEVYEEARTQVVSPDMIPEYSLDGDSDDDDPEARTEMVSSSLLEPLHLEESVDEEARTEMVSGSDVEVLGLDEISFVSDEEDEPEPAFDNEKTQMSESLMGGPPESSAPLEIELTPLSEPAAPAEDDFHAEKTELYESPFENDPICPRLSVLEGPTAGQEFLINRLRNTVGRGTNNTIVVGDLAMSRQHFEINQNPDESFFLKDLNSINGTQLNGARVQEADLFHGDRLEAGKTTFQFLVPGNAPQPTRQRRVVAPSIMATVTEDDASPRVASPPASASREGLQKALLYITIGAAILSVLLISAIAFIALRSSSPTDAVTPSQVYMQGVEAIQARDWDKAEERFRKTIELEPKFENVPDQLTRIEMERESQRTIMEAREIADGEASTAFISRLEKISHQSVYFDEATKLSRQLRQSKVYASFEAAQRLVQAGSHDEALKELNQLLELVPHHEGALALKSDIENREEDAPEPTPAPREPEESPTADPVQEPRPERAEVVTPTPRETARPKAKVDDDDWTIEPLVRPKTTKKSVRPAAAVNFTEGFRLYRARNFTQAAAHFQSIADGSEGALAQRAGRLASDVRRFERSYNSANEALRGKRWSQAVRHLEEAKRNDVSVAGNNSVFQADISNKLATAQAELGLLALKEGEVERARNHHRQASANNRGDATVQRLGRELEAR
ncbi:MAG: FHA domain-containing protein [Bradymonadaceae bacterium]